MAGRQVIITLVGEDKASPAFKKVAKSADDLDKSTKKSAASGGQLAQVLGNKLPGAGGTAVGALGDLMDAGAGTGAGMLAVAGAATAAGVASVKFALDSAKAASALNEQINQTRNVFGGAADEILAFGENASDALMLSNEAALRAANNFGSVFKGVGFADQAAAQFSKTMVRLAADLASAKDLDIGDVLTKLRSGLVGESEPLRDLGVSISEATTKAKAFELGLQGVNGEISDADKQVARLVQIVQATSAAHGDAAETAQSYANAQRRLSAEIQDFKAQAGSSILPMLEGIVGGFTKLADGAAQSDKELSGTEKTLKSVNDVAKRVSIGVLSMGWSEGIRAFSNWGKKGEDSTKSLNDALQDYAQYIHASAENTEGGRAALEALQKATSDAERVSGVLSTTLETETQKQERAAKAAKEHADALDAAEDATFGLASAERSMVDAVEGIADAEEGLADAQRDLNDLRRKGAVDAGKVADATNDLERSSRSLADAQEGLADAEKELLEVRRGASAFDVRGGEIDIERARLNQERAAQRLIDAEERLADPELDPTDRKDAELDLVDARLDVEESARSTLEAERQLTEIRQQGTSADERVRDAEERVKDARLRVKDATVARGQAEAALRAARAGDPEFLEKIRAAEDRVGDATRKVTDAKWRAGDAAVALRDAQERLSSSLSGVAGGVDHVNGRMQALINLYPQLAQVFGLLQSMGGGSSLTITPAQTGPRNSGSFRQLASGGHMRPGEVAIVGEDGPELAVAGPAGTQIIPTGSAGKGAAFGAAASPVVINATFNVYGTTDADRLVRETLVKLRQEVRRSGALGLENGQGR